MIETLKSVFHTLLRTYEQGVINQNIEGDYFATNIPLFVTLLCAIAIVAYLIGSINVSIIVSKKLGIDIRESGSGNAGATNMSRQFGKKVGILILLTDIIKSLIACIIGILLVGFQYGGFIAGLFCIIGHAFPVFFKFKGGKGVACMAAMVLVTSPVCFLVMLIIYLVLLFGFKMVSFASVMSVMIYPLLLSSLQGIGINFIIALTCSFLVLFLHRKNIIRIFNHEEPRIEIFKKKEKKTRVIEKETDEDSEE